ncbi:MAG: 50S ribosomal protein L28 [Candidatus Aerophobetes bacterium ADurb.Bin490]|nr:MAG: 50S ribosomal protein L28 [Candidatus Aerophobetes bacterium ADurb.Bin490]HNZ28754.1 50S ribosomal protein L28 [Candidatus Goldiibacteriota bacterium]HPI03632.1 50S ribosomal protein L28 [Candidatus Goldiibacteriota bacterium]HPN65596.1 50S ribosomal protein L28 [Candidatus Goldiibacteriota bacterium]HRQ43280.1 50S ribosomal protein L28 [Candidatus Goldiibacteriota bacterium]
MAKKCVVCDKQVVTGNNVSHANNKTRTTNKPNLQNVKIVLKGKVTREWVCTRCLRSGKVKKAA